MLEIQILSISFNGKHWDTHIFFNVIFRGRQFLTDTYGPCERETAVELHDGGHRCTKKHPSQLLQPRLVGMREACAPWERACTLRASSRGPTRPRALRSSQAPKYIDGESRTARGCLVEKPPGHLATSNRTGVAWTAAMDFGFWRVRYESVSLAHKETLLF